ncbi:MAG TPA: hypothetical protein VIF02_00295 [Methylocella sp.]|jgi:hypothetical protein
MDGVEIQQIAKNCRTIVETIEKYFTSHFKMSFDAAALNMRKPKRIAKKEMP